MTPSLGTPLSSFPISQGVYSFPLGAAIALCSCHFILQHGIYFKTHYRILYMDRKV